MEPGLRHGNRSLCHKFDFAYQAHPFIKPMTERFRDIVRHEYGHVVADTHGGYRTRAFTKVFGTVRESAFAPNQFVSPLRRHPARGGFRRDLHALRPPERCPAAQVEDVGYSTQVDVRRRPPCLNHLHTSDIKENS